MILTLGCLRFGGMGFRVFGLGLGLVIFRRVDSLVKEIGLFSKHSILPLTPKEKLSNEPVEHFRIRFPYRSWVCEERYVCCSIKNFP